MTPGRLALKRFPPRALRILRTAILAGLWAPLVHAQWRPEEDRPLPSGSEVMKKVRESLDGRIVVVAGSLESLDRDGEVESARPVRIRFDWTGDWPRVQVEIRDAFGSPVAEATLESDSSGGVTARVTRNETDASGRSDTSDTQVPGLDLAWTDLSLGFLWWPGGVTEQEELKLGRVCHVVRIPAPASGSPYAAVRLWIDEKESALLQADGLDARGNRIRRLAVRSLRKSDDGIWMIKDFELSGTGRGAPRAVLSFDSVVEKSTDESAWPGDGNDAGVGVERE
ncbi:MAG: outer membrane lipoprotein-sorting protein [Kiritimatiellae bacterium]|nr:outer membrane lipoprotein-sorting protein [Kiritimatiellia bacterium]